MVEFETIAQSVSSSAFLERGPMSNKTELVSDATENNSVVASSNFCLISYRF